MNRQALAALEKLAMEALQLLLRIQAALVSQADAPIANCG